MHVDERNNDSICFTKSELSMLEKRNPTLYSIADWIANHPEMKYGRKHFIKIEKDNEVWFSTNYDRCPIGSILCPYASNQLACCAGYSCSMGCNYGKPTPKQYPISCLELRWKDILNGTTDRYRHMSIEERIERFDCSPIIMRMGIKLI